MPPSSAVANALEGRAVPQLLHPDAFTRQLVKGACGLLTSLPEATSGGPLSPEAANTIANVSLLVCPCPHFCGVLAVGEFRCATVLRVLPDL